MLPKIGCSTMSFDWLFSDADIMPSGNWSNFISLAASWRQRILSKLWSVSLRHGYTLIRGVDPNAVLWRHHCSFTTFCISSLKSLSRQVTLQAQAYDKKLESQGGQSLAISCAGTLIVLFLVLTTVHNDSWQLNSKGPYWWVHPVFV